MLAMVPRVIYKIMVHLALGTMMFTISTGQPILMEQQDLSGVKTFVNISGESVKTMMVLFHGCNNQGHDWFQKPEEIVFLHKAILRKIAVVAFTNPRHRGNFCWPSPDEEYFLEATNLLHRALLELLDSLKKPPKPLVVSSVSLILVGASSGGIFASRLPAIWRNKLLNLAQVTAFLSVVSPTSFVRKTQLLEQPGADFPPTGLVYMPRDTTFASEEAIETFLGSLHQAGVAAKAWALAPQQLTAETLIASLQIAGIFVEDKAVQKFIEALTDLGLLMDGEVIEDPRRIPWRRAVALLDAGVQGHSRQHRHRCLEEVLNRAWAQHEFGMDAEVIDWLLYQSNAQVVKSEL